MVVRRITVKLARPTLMLTAQGAHKGRTIGMGFKQTDRQGNIRLFWIKRRDLLRFSRAWQLRLSETLQRIAIPPERYAEYQFCACESPQFTPPALTASRAEDDQRD